MMATTDDLRAVLRAREAYAGDIDALLDRLSTGSKRTHRRVVPALAAAAAVLVATAVAVTAVTTSPGGSNRQQPGSVATGSLSARRLDFAVSESTGVTPWQFDASPAEQSVQLTYKKMWMQLLVYSPDNPGATPYALRGVTVGNQVPGAEFVSVAGHPGYVGRLVDMRSFPPASLTSPDDVPGNELAWQYAPGAWAIVTPQGAHPSTTDLLDVASAVDFSRHTSLRSAIELSDRPAGMRLIEQEQTYARDPWRTLVTYGTRDQSQEISISAQRVAGGSNTLPDSIPVTVGDRQGMWNAEHQVLTLYHADQAVQLDVFAERGSMSLDQAIAVAKTVTVTADPAHPDTWFAADKALP